MSKRARPDIQVCVAFLCTRVKALIEQDYKKFGKGISYLKETVHLLLVVNAVDNGKSSLNIDALFAVHLDFKSHTGACLMLEHGSILSLYAKEKLTLKAQLKLNLLVLMMS